MEASTDANGKTTYTCPSGGGQPSPGLTATVSSPSSGFFGSLSRGYTGSAFGGFGGSGAFGGGGAGGSWSGPARFRSRGTISDMQTITLGLSLGRMLSQTRTQVDNQPAAATPVGSLYSAMFSPPGQFCLGFCQGYAYGSGFMADLPETYTPAQAYGQVVGVGASGLFPMQEE